MPVLTRHSLSQGSVLQGTGAKQGLPERIPQMEPAASSAPQGTTVLRVPPTTRAPQLLWEGGKVPCSTQMLVPAPHIDHISSALYPWLSYLVGHRIFATTSAPHQTYPAILKPFRCEFRKPV